MMHGTQSRVNRVLGLRDELINEIIAICVVLAGLLVSFALLTENDGSNWIGRLGSGLYMFLTFLLGKYVAFLVPLLILGWGASIWSQCGLTKMPVRVVGLFVAAVSICSLLALPYAEIDLVRNDGFRVGGALGNFMVHRECMNFKGILGVAGTYMLFMGMLVISLALMTDSLVRSTLAFAIEHLHPSKLIPLFFFWKRLPKPAAPQQEVADETSPPRRAPSPVPSQGPEFQSKPRIRYTEAARLDPVPRREPAPQSPPQKAPAPLERVKADGTVALTNEVLDALEAEGRPQPKKQKPPTSFSSILAPPVVEEDLLSGLGKPAPVRAVQDELLPQKLYEMPGMELLNQPPRVENRMSAEEINTISDTLERTLSDFGITAEVVQVTQGPTVTRFELQPAPGIKVSRILSLENDIAMCLKAESVRIIAPIPGKAAVGLEVPNRKPTPVFLREMLATEAFLHHTSPLAFALGKTISGEPYICDLAAMPHLLIAGTTGSGKSVCLNSVICSILFRMEPEKVKFVMIDPKRVELNVYQAIPHLLAPVVCEPRKAAAALTWAIEQMEERYKKLAALGVRNIDGYNAIVRSSEPHPKAMGRRLEYMPHIVIVIDELADLMIIARNEVEDNIIRLAQMSRAVGMHLILATQRPSVNVITGIIKANFPSRVAFQVSSKVDSRTILDTNGAEALLGRGDMLFSPGGSPKPIRLQGCYMSDQEVERIADWVRAQQKASYEKQDFKTQQEIEAERQAASSELRMNGVDADDMSVPRPDDDDSGYDYTYQQQRSDGRDIKDVLSGNLAHSSNVRPMPSNEESDAIDEELFHQAVKLILVHKKASVSLLQRKLKIGFARAGRVMDMIEEAHIVGPNVGSKVREIIVDPEEYLEQMENKFAPKL